VVDEHGGSGVGYGQPVKREGADEAGVKDSDASRDRDGVGEVACQVGDHERCELRERAHGGKRRPENGDVEQQVAEGADKAPAGPGQCVASAADSDADVIEPCGLGVLVGDAAGDLR
jgi:hypothetical protein